VDPAVNAALSRRLSATEMSLDPVDWVVEMAKGAVDAVASTL
jgi:hypothetical protein